MLTTFRALHPVRLLLLGTLVLMFGGCPSSTVSQRNPYLTYAEEFGAGTAARAGSAVNVGTSLSDATFRQFLTLTFQNAHPEAVLDTSLMAWVSVSSIRTAEQQDALLRGGYSQLTQPMEIGSAYTLPVGTFVYTGPGGETRIPINLDPLESLTYDIITPDAILVFSHPPVSCDSVAFSFAIDGVVPTGPATSSVGGYKTLAQISAYQCQPFEPGLFLRRTGGQTAPNEFTEGQAVTYTFQQGSTNGAFAVVSFGTVPTIVTDADDTGDGQSTGDDTTP